MYWLIRQLETFFSLQDKCGASFRCFIFLLIWQIPVICMFVGKKRIGLAFMVVQRLAIKSLATIFVVVAIPALLADWIALPIIQSSFALVGKSVNASDLVVGVARWIFVCFYEIIVARQYLKCKLHRGFHFQMPTAGNGLCLGHDSPITSEVNDIFNRGPFVRMLCDAICRAQVSRTAEYIGVFAPWGAGKTSVLNLLKRELAIKDPSTGCRRGICIDFNPWKFRSAPEALVGLLRQLSDSLMRYKETNAADVFRSYAHLLRLRGVEVNGGFLGDAIDMLRRVFFAFVHNDEKTIQKVRIVLRNVKSRIVVAVDDLERMPANDVCEIVAFLKTNFDLPNVVILYLSDKEHLARSLEQLYITDERTENINLGHKYLEKIIPHQFNLLEIPKEAIMKYFSIELRKMAKDIVMPKYNFETDDGDEFDTVRGYVKTIRDVKLLLNKIWEEIVLHKNSTRSGALNLHLGDLVALTAIRMWSPNVYNGLPEFVAEMTARLSGVHDTNRIGMSPEEIDKWVSEHETNGDVQLTVRSFLEKRIGLKLIGDVGGERNFILSGYSDSTRRFGCRLSSTDYFRLYFEDFTDVKHVRLEVLMNFEKQIEQGILPEKLLQESIEDGSLPILLYTLEGQPEFSGQSATEMYFKTLLWLSTQKFDDRFFKTANEPRLGYIHPFEYNVYDSIARCIQQYVSRYNGKGFVHMGDKLVRPSGVFPEDAAQILFRTALEIPSVFLVWQFISWDSNRHGNRTMNYAGQLFSHDDYDKLENCYLDNIEQMERAGKLFDSIVFFDLMRAWTLILKRRKLDKRRGVMCKLLLKDLDKLENVRKFLPFVMKSPVFFEGMALEPSTFFGINVKDAKERFNEEILKKLNATLKANTISDYDLNMVKYALEYVVQNKMDAEKCKYENQLAYVQDKLGIKRSVKNTFVS